MLVTKEQRIPKVKCGKVFVGRGWSKFDIGDIKWGMKLSQCTGSGLSHCVSVSVGFNGSYCLCTKINPSQSLAFMLMLFDNRQVWDDWNSNQKNNNRSKILLAKKSKKAVQRAIKCLSRFTSLLIGTHPLLKPISCGINHWINVPNILFKEVSFDVKWCLAGALEVVPTQTDLK